VAPVATTGGPPSEILGNEVVAEPATPVAMQQPVAHQYQNATSISPGLVDAYHRHRFIILDLLPRCNKMEGSAAYKAFKEVELILYIASSEGLIINYHSSSVTPATPGGMNLEDLVLGLHLSTGAFRSLQNKLTLYFRVWLFLAHCDALDEAHTQLPEHMVTTRAKCVEWTNFPTLEVPTGGFSFISPAPLVQFKGLLKEYIVSYRCTRLCTQKIKTFL
jgi:hypothetical protein